MADTPQGRRGRRHPDSARRNLHGSDFLDKGKAGWYQPRNRTDPET